MKYLVTVQLDGELVCGSCFYAGRAVVDGTVSVLKVNTDGEITEAYAGRMEDGEMVRPFYRWK